MSDMNEAIHEHVILATLNSITLKNGKTATTLYDRKTCNLHINPSGKDPTKVDRSAAYACRWMAKSVVKSGLCKRALVQLSYAIGVAKPLSLFVETYGTEQ